ncbi:putative dolichyl-diphosphooligosaccharide--protein glycosyltransferase subunit 3B [Prunus yedoensis var. nudiflora]|uniref:Putative dolichyl-diphosphooligosaccharide--protein glycosyltransferase subunit 3B n=1 Tax=Prunus yedoensis var. nudiflora TaxID=2094558 RepID=A0A314ZCZ1_PRUYE|nr:putative dolichyl-diphosphooligosaccharide--protein glycosyltransferase subunit 3B [Prunus yedoensis var. nudiflora]
MGPIPKLPLVFFITTLLFLTTFIGLSESNSDQVAELLSLQARSKSGVIRLDDHSLSRFLTSVKTPRPYWVLIFFDAAKLHDKHELHLKELRSEFSLSLRLSSKTMKTHRLLPTPSCSSATSSFKTRSTALPNSESTRCLTFVSSDPTTASKSPSKWTRAISRDWLSQCPSSSSPRPNSSWVRFSALRCYPRSKLCSLPSRG